MNNGRQQLAELLEQLRDPMRLRVAVCGVALAFGYFALYLPADTKINRAARQLTEVKRKTAVLGELRSLEEQAAMLEGRLGSKENSTCVQHIVDGIRQQTVKLLRLEPVGSQRVGNLDAAEFHLDVEGRMEELDQVLAWLDTNPLLFRVVSFRVSPSREEKKLPVMQLKFFLLKERS